MKRRNFLRGLLGTSAVVVSAPVIAKLIPDSLSQSSMGKVYADMGEPVIGTPMKGKALFTGDLVSISEDGKQILAASNSQITGVFINGEVVDIFSPVKK